MPLSKYQSPGEERGKGTVEASMAARASMTNWSEGVDSAILEAKVVSNMLMWRWGRRTCSELSSEVSTSSFHERASVGPMAVPGV